MSSQAAETNIHIRARAQERDLIDRAARIRGMNRSQFILAVATKEAADVVLDQSVFYLDDAEYAAFVHALDNPPEPNEKLKALLASKPVWSVD
jgi:uncharacterized protein (DUF1778 family)